MCSEGVRTILDLNKCDVLFICVPTPPNNEYQCDLNIVKKVMKEINEMNYQGIIVMRSTVIIGTYDELRVNMMPEFLTELNWKLDFINCKNFYFGLNNLHNYKSRLTLSQIINNAFNEGKINYNNV